MKIIVGINCVHTSGTGKGVSAYIVDSGVLPSNRFFAGRAFAVYDAIKDGQKVGNPFWHVAFRPKLSAWRKESERTPDGAQRSHSCWKITTNIIYLA